jgi:hypothetical protein
MPTIETLQYLNAVNEALSKPEHEIMTTDECHDCDRRIEGDRPFNVAEHWVMRDAKTGTLVVVIGCEGYYEINPQSVGIEMEHWMGIEGVNI